MIEGGSEDSIEAFKKALFAPPANVTKAYLATREEWSPESQSDAFMAAMGGAPTVS